MVSVIIPMYNAENTIIRCVESVVHQLPDNELEILITDDGSKDNSYDVIKHHIEENNYNNIHLFKQDNKGVSSARNNGIRKAKGKFIAFIDSDDIWLEGKLKHQIEIIEKYNVDFVGSLINYQPLGFPYKSKNGIYEVTFKKLLIKLAPQTSTALFKKELVDKVGMFHEYQRYGEDGNLWLRFSRVAKMVIIDKTYAIAGDFKPRFGQSGLSGNIKAMTKANFDNLKEMFDFGYISRIEYYIYFVFYMIKHYRRVLKVNIKVRQ
jgi:glycosyltransferase involved in cell wall biosynthesis